MRRSLLVILNPLSGRRRARSLYARTVAPLFAAGGIRAAVRETQWPGHAAEMVGQLTAAELRDMDGEAGRGGGCNRAAIELQCWQGLHLPSVLPRVASAFCAATA